MPYEYSDPDLGKAIEAHERFRAAQEGGYLNTPLTRQSSLLNRNFPTALPAAPYASGQDWKRYLSMLLSQLLGDQPYEERR